jgi:hypothetical protein
MLNNIIKLALLVTMVVSCALAHAAKVTATLDRTNIGLNETIKLTLSSDNSFELPDLSPIENFLQFVHSSQQQQTRIINGKRTHQVSIVVYLLAIKAGSFTIPQFTIGAIKTAAIDITIANTPASRALDQAISVSMTVDIAQPYVQQQVIVTTKLLIKHDLYNAMSNANLDKFEPDGVVILELADNRYSKVINGVHYNVIEQKHALFPQQSGKLLLPSRKFTAAVGFRRRINEIADAIELNVQAASYSDTTWLPATALNITSNTNNIQTSVGETLTLTIKLTANGLQHSLLPNIALPTIGGAKIYQDRVNSENTKIHNSITGTKEQTWVIVPTRAGVIKLPDIKLKWFNTTSNQSEFARLAGTQITVLASSTQGTTAQKTVQQPTRAQDKTAMGQSNYLWWLYAAIAILTALWLATLLAWYLWHKRHTKLTSKPTAKQPALKINNVYRELIKACDDNDLLHAKTVFIIWVQLAVGTSNIVGISDALLQLQQQYTQDSLDVLTDAFKAIDKALYNKDVSSNLDDGKQLKTAIVQLVQLPKTKSTTTLNIYH